MKKHPARLRAQRARCVSQLRPVYDAQSDYTCMMCGADCTTNEEVHTGDTTAFNGYEMWVYCPACDVETFHRGRDPITGKVPSEV